MIESPAAVVDFPLRGEWCATNTPAERVPSHGTDFFAQRYALDFVRMDESGTFYYDGGLRAVGRHLTVGLPASAFFCWDAPVYSAAAGRVLAACDGWPDRAHVRLLWELGRVTLAPPSVAAGGDYRPLAGNYVAVEGACGVALYAHLRRGSLTVRAGERVEAGAVLGAVGNSGNSTMPHLHFQIMDGPDAMTACGVPCVFRRYERWTGAAWEVVERGVPGRHERVRA